MDIISKAIDEIKFRIPRQILDLAYLEPTYYRQAPLSLDELIRIKTINARVLVDANLVGGETVPVELGGLTPIEVDKYNYVYEIPANRLNHRTILSALSVAYMTYNSVANNYMPGTSVSTPGRVNDVSSNASKVMDSHSSIPIVANAEVYLVGHNTVMIRNHLVTAMVATLRCIVANDSMLNNISIRSTHDFADLCEMAVKSYIYNTLLIKIDEGQLRFGKELGSIKAYIDGLADAETNYQTILRERWAAIAFMNDQLSYEHLLRLQINSGI